MRRKRPQVVGRRRRYVRTLPAKSVPVRAPTPSRHGGDKLVARSSARMNVAERSGIANFRSRRSNGFCHYCRVRFESAGRACTYFAKNASATVDTRRVRPAEANKCTRTTATFSRTGRRPSVTVLTGLSEEHASA